MVIRRKSTTPDPSQSSATTLQPGIARPCAAYGCPLGGTWNPNTIGEGGSWWCYIHSELPPELLQNATAVIRANQPLLKELHELQVDRFHNGSHNIPRTLTLRRRLFNLVLDKPREPGEDDE